MIDASTLEYCCADAGAVVDGTTTQRQQTVDCVVNPLPGVTPPVVLSVIVRSCIDEYVGIFCS